MSVILCKVVDIGSNLKFWVPTTLRDGKSSKALENQEAIFMVDNSPDLLWFL